MLDIFGAAAAVVSAVLEPVFDNELVLSLFWRVVPWSASGGV